MRGVAYLILAYLVLGVQIGLVQTIVLGGAWTALASLLVFATGLRHVRAHPTLEMAA